MTNPAITPDETEALGPTQVDREDILTILAKYDGHTGGLIAILEDIQRKYRYLPQEALRIVCDETRCSPVDVYGIATFYRAFSLTPRGKHLVSVCLGTACHVRGAPMVEEEFERQLGIKAGETTSDKLFTLETVNCLGACALGPVVVIDGHYFSKVKTSGVRQLLDRASTGLEDVQVSEDKKIFPIDVSCPLCNHSLMDTDFVIDGHPSIHLSVCFDQKHGWVRLSSLYGSFNMAAEHDIPAKTVVSFLCPHCHGQLTGGYACPECEAPMAAMTVCGGGIVHVCTRRGCHGSRIELDGINA